MAGVRAFPGHSVGRRALGRVAVGAVVALLAAPALAESPPLRVKGLTYVGSRGEDSELVLRSEMATFYPDTDVAKLRSVQAVVTNEEEADSFEMTCDRAELNTDTNDFRAEGNVEGVTGDGQRYSAPWVEYEHDASVLRTDAPVLVVNDTGTFSGEGFRYDVQAHSFRLLGRVRVVQTP